MRLLNESYSTYEEFELIRIKTDKRLEFIDGVIYMSPSPNIKHQEISSYLHGQSYNLLKGGKCKVFAAPTDVVFNNESADEKRGLSLIFLLFVTKITSQKMNTLVFLILLLRY